jgi:1-acyl-sn-glycerol-3-phosphate acyltransferase
VQYRVSRVLAGPLLRGFVRPTVIGLEHIPATGGAIIASNHLSIVDSIYLPLMVPRPVTFAAKSEYFTGTRLIDKLTAAYLRSTNQLAVDRTGPRAAQDMLEAALERLRGGDLFGIYPEGTRSPDGRLYRGRIGVGWLAVNSGLPVVPVAMKGTDRVLAPGRIVPHPGRIQITIGKPVSFGPEMLQGPSAKVRRTITDEIMRAIGELSGQEYVPMYASTRKEELAAAKEAAKAAKDAAKEAKGR